MAQMNEERNSMEYSRRTAVHASEKAKSDVLSEKMKREQDLATLEIRLQGEIETRISNALHALECTLRSVQAKISSKYTCT